MTTAINSWNQVDGSTRHVMPGPYPVCDGCDCVAGCSNVKDKVCLPKVQPPTAQPVQPAEMSDADLSDDDALRFAQRVLASPGTEEDRKTASDGLWAVRKRVRKATIAQPQQSAAMPVFQRYDWDCCYCMGKEEDGRYVLYDNVAAAWPKGTV